MPRTQRKHGKGPRSKARIGRRYKNNLWSRKQTSLDNEFGSTRLEDESGKPPDSSREPSHDNRAEPREDNRKPPDDTREPPDDSREPPDDSREPPHDNWAEPREDSREPPDDSREPPDDSREPLGDSGEPVLGVSLGAINEIVSELAPNVPADDCSETMQLQASVQESLDSCAQLLALNGLPEGWFFSYTQVELRIFETFSQCHLKPLIILRLLLIKEDLTWEVHVADHAVPYQCAILDQFPSSMNNESLLSLIGAVSSASVCQGNFDVRYIAMARIRKGIFTSQGGEVVAYLDQSFCITVNGEQHSTTVRHAKCELLIAGDLCAPCYGFCNTLRALFSKLRNRSVVPSVYTNTRFLRTPQKSARIKSLQKALHIKTRQLKQLRMRLDSILESNGVVVADDLRCDLEKVVDSHQVLEEDEFKRVFWEQQVAAWKAKKTGVRWHPLFIRWCLNIMLTSSKTYQIIRESGFICLPSQRTLKDYTHWTKLQPGFNADLFNHMIQEAKVDQMKDWERYVILVLDEMKIRADLVFNKMSGEITGFVDYGAGTLEHKFTQLQQQCKQQKLSDREVATHMLTVMVRGLTFHLDLPIAHFATTGATAEQLMPVVWRAIRML
ncbi:uncharacterized protein [Dysidea avara]|uniref:uncharacterized protein n=1 Tax=Dysidea avara TaxID=196820 RepID=UPI0033266F0A